MNRLIFLFIFLSLQLHANEAEPLSRVYGHIIGDILEQRVELSNNGVAVELTDLPTLQRVGPWVQRLSAQTTVDEEGLTWLSMRYQVINAPLETKEVALPALVLQTKSNDQFEVAAQAFSLLPLTMEANSEESNLPFMMPDRTPELTNSKVASKKLRYAMTGLGITVLAWLAWWLWLQQRDKTALPFSKAMNQLRRLRRITQQGVNDNTEAWSAVHEALNSAAGQTLSSRTAASQLNHLRWLEPFGNDIESFYKASDQRFFKPNANQTPFELFDFCKALYRAEKQNTVEARSVAQH